MTLSIVIPNYNGAELLAQNFPHVVSAAEFYTSKTGAAVDIVVVDDGSIDESRTFIKSQISNSKSQKTIINLIENQRNQGFSHAVNKGVKLAGGKVIVLLNTDVKPDKDFLIPLVKHFDDKKVFAVGCLEKSIEEVGTVLRGRGVGYWKRGFLLHGRGEVDASNTLWVSGGSGAFRKDIWEKLGGLDILFSPFYWEDIDLSYRALKVGYAVLFEKNSVTTHTHAKGAIRQHYSQETVKKIAYRNQFFFVWKNITDSSLLLSHVVWLPIHLFFAFVQNDTAFLSAFIQAMHRLPEVLVKRRQIGRARTDKEILMLHSPE